MMQVLLTRAHMVQKNLTQTTHKADFDNSEGDQEKERLIQLVSKEIRMEGEAQVSSWQILHARNSTSIFIKLDSPVILSESL